MSVPTRDDRVETGLSCNPKLAEQQDAGHTCDDRRDEIVVELYSGQTIEVICEAKWDRAETEENYDLPSFLLDRDIDRDGIERIFDEAENTNGWLIFYGHDVTDRPSLYGCTPGLLRHALQAAARRKMPTLTMAEALRCARP